MDMEAPSWVRARLRDNANDHYLLLLDNTEYMGRSDANACGLHLACLNGQTPATLPIPHDLMADLDGFPRWTPPGTDSSAIVEWYNAIGPGCKCSVWFDEDEEGSEARPSACG